jgi:hypothetical protein
MFLMSQIDWRQTRAPMRPLLKKMQKKKRGHYRVERALMLKEEYQRPRRFGINLGIIMKNPLITHES